MLVKHIMNVLHYSMFSCLVFSIYSQACTNYTCHKKLRAMGFDSPGFSRYVFICVTVGGFECKQTVPLKKKVSYLHVYVCTYIYILNMYTLAVMTVFFYTYYTYSCLYTYMYTHN